MRKRGTNAAIIGARIGGIASAIRLALKGYDVQVFETNACAGGKLSELEIDGFRFDAGPSLFTMPQYVDELFGLAGRNPADYFSYIKLDLICSYFFEDGTELKAWADGERLAREIEEKTEDSGASVKKFLEKSAEIYSITHHVFLEKSLHKAATYFDKNTFKSILKFPKIDPFRTMNEAVQNHFRDSRTVRFFNRYATYNGSDPFRAPATLNVIPHLEHHFGAYFPEGGMYSMTSALVRLARELGVRFHFNTRAEEILIEGKEVRGLRLADGQVLEASLIVSNLDVWFTYHKLLKTEKFPDRVLSQERSSSALIFYWGINQIFPQLSLHNIFFSEDYAEEFEAIWRDRSICSDPTVYINISSKVKQDDAPQGCENWFVVINVPANSGQDWDKLIQDARSNILRKLKRVLKIDIAPLIIAESVLDPRSIEVRTGSYQGSLYGTSSNNRFAAFLRHPNFTRRIKGLYFAGGSVHPGGGIPLALLSAKIAVDSV